MTQQFKETTPFFSFVKTKESSDSKRYTFIGASTLPDRVRDSKVKGEILSKNVLDKFATKINDTSRLGGDYGSYRTISLFHNRVYKSDYTLEEAGYVVPGSAKVLELEQNPGNYGLFVDVEVNEKYVPPSDNPDYTPDKIHYKIEKGALGLSLEYNNRPEQEKIVTVGTDAYRYIVDSDDFRGFGFARPDLIGNTSAVRVKEITLRDPSEENKAGETSMDEAKMKEMQNSLNEANAKIKELQSKIVAAESLGVDAKVKELKEQLATTEAKVKEIKLANDETAAKLKESIELAFSGLKFNAPARAEDSVVGAKVKEIYSSIEQRDFVKFKEQTQEYLEANGAKLKEMMARDGSGFNFERHQTVQVKCKGNKMVVVPTAKTKDVLDSSDMAEATYSQTNAMFADRYVAGITETFLKEGSLLSVLPKEQHIGGNDKYQWRIWTEFETVTGDSTLSVNPTITSVSRQVRDFEKMETRICEYRDGVEVTDFTQAHSMAAIGDLLGAQLLRAAEAVTDSMNADLFKPKTDGTSGWDGFCGLIGFADSSTYTSLYGKTRSAANRLLDATLANTFVTTSEGISLAVIRAGYEKVLAHGSSLSDLIIVAHPTQVRRLFDAEEASIRHNIVTMSAAPASWGFDRAVIPYVDGIPVIRDYRCESSAAAADMFAVVDISPSKGLNLVVSKPLSARGLAKVGASESAYVNFWGCAVYKSPRNVFVHTSLLTT